MVREVPQRRMFRGGKTFASSSMTKTMAYNSAASKLNVPGRGNRQVESCIVQAHPQPWAEDDVEMCEMR